MSDIAEISSSVRVGVQPIRLPILSMSGRPWHVLTAGRVGVRVRHQVNVRVRARGTGRLSAPHELPGRINAGSRNARQAPPAARSQPLVYPDLTGMRNSHHKACAGRIRPLAPEETRNIGDAPGRSLDDAAIKRTHAAPPGAPDLDARTNRRVDDK